MKLDIVGKSAERLTETANRLGVDVGIAVSIGCTMLMLAMDYESGDIAKEDQFGRQDTLEALRDEAQAIVAAGGMTSDIREKIEEDEYDTPSDQEPSRN